MAFIEPIASPIEEDIDKLPEDRPGLEPEAFEAGRHSVPQTEWPLTEPPASKPPSLPSVPTWSTRRGKRKIRKTMKFLNQKTPSSSSRNWPYWVSNDQLHAKDS